MYLEVPATPDVLCSVHSKITWILLPFFAILLFFFLEVRDYLINLALVLFQNCSNSILLIVLP
jgi:hypothetical protein